jgi:hypothetical protein
LAEHMMVIIHSRKINCPIKEKKKRKSEGKYNTLQVLAFSRR